jgi:hypothetical protein
LNSGSIHAEAKQGFQHTAAKGESLVRKKSGPCHHNQLEKKPQFAAFSIIRKRGKDAAVSML